MKKDNRMIRRLQLFLTTAALIVSVTHTVTAINIQNQYQAMRTNYQMVMELNQQIIDVAQQVMQTSNDTNQLIEMFAELVSQLNW